MTDLKSYKKDLRKAINRAKSESRKEILRDYLRAINRAEKTQADLSKKTGVEKSDIEIVPVKYLRNIKKGSAKAMARQERDIIRTAKEIEDQAYREISNLLDKMREIQSDTRGTRLSGAHIWEAPGRDYSGAAARMVEAAAQDLDYIISDAIERLGAIEVSNRLNRLYGDSMEYELERIAYGNYDPVYRRSSGGRAQWDAAINRLKQALA